VKKVIFFGTPPFAAKVLKFLLINHIDILAIVTKPDKPRGRGKHSSFSAVKKWAHENYPHIPILQPNKASSHTFITQLKCFNPDLLVVVAYGEIISQELLNLPKLGAINLHASLLPQYRGASPIQSVLFDGMKRTGVTIIEMTHKMDAGDILSQEEVLISEEMNCQELEEELCKVGCILLLKVIKQYHTLTKTPQNHTKATYVQKIQSNMTQIDWQCDAQHIHNQVRALSPSPGAWCYIILGENQKRLKIYRSRVKKGTNHCLPGETLSFTPQGWHVACKEGGGLLLLELQLEGKRRLSAKEFYQGISFPLKIKI